MASHTTLDTIEHNTGSLEPGDLEDADVEQALAELSRAIVVDTVSLRGIPQGGWRVSHRPEGVLF